MMERQITIQQTPGAVLYTRVSTGEQAKEGTSLGDQRDACRAKALALGLPIVAEYEDAGISGGFLLTRPGMQSALADINTGRADTLICANISRYSRDVEHQQAIKKAVKAAGGRLVFCDMDFDDTPEGDLAFGIMGGFAEYEKAVIKKRTVGGRIRRAEAGIQTARTYSPFGYKIVGRDDVLRGEYPADQLGQYQVVEAQAEIVRELFTRYASGVASLTGLTRWLNDTGTPTRLGAAFWRVSTVSYILKNPVYKGLGVYGRKDHSHDETRQAQRHPLSGRPLKTTRTQRDADPSTWITWPVPAIVSEAVWDAANGRGAENKKMGGNPSRVRMLAGRIFCPHCGTGIVCAMYDKRRGQTEARHYVCGHYSRVSINTGRRECDPTYYEIAAVEEAVLTALLHAAEHPAAVQAALTAYREALPAPSTAGHRTAELAQAEADLRQIERKQAAAVQAQIAGIMAGADPAAYSAVFAEIAGQRTQLEAQRQRLSQSLAAAPLSPTPAPRPGKLSKIATETLHTQILSDIRRVLTSPSLPGEDKRDTLGTVIEKVYPTKDGAKVVFLPNTFQDLTLQGLPNALICAGLSRPDCSRNKTL
jgi:site-specific DNA recombinase